MAREIASTLDARGAVADADRLRTALVTWIADPDPGIAWSAATDLVRHAPLCEALTETQRASILAAFLAQPSGKRSKAALAEAVAVARPAGAAAAIVDLVGTEETRWLTRAFASALVRIGDPEAETFVLRRLRAADAALSRDLLEVLAEIGGARGADAARGRLADADGRVRIDAAHAFGRIVRRLRGYSGRPSEAEGRADLAAAYDRSKSADEARAALWALAQLDHAEAYEVLRKAETGDARADVRRDARRYLLNPRLSFVLAGS
jgi:hypothetical protein